MLMRPLLEGAPPAAEGLREKTGAVARRSWPAPIARGKRQATPGGAGRYPSPRLGVRPYGGAPRHGDPLDNVDLGRITSAGERCPGEVWVEAMAGSIHFVIGGSEGAHPARDQILELSESLPNANRVSRRRRGEPGDSFGTGGRRHRVWVDAHLLCRRAAGWAIPRRGSLRWRLAAWPALPGGPDGRAERGGAPLEARRHPRASRRPSPGHPSSASVASARHGTMPAAKAREWVHTRAPIFVPAPGKRRRTSSLHSVT
jgi:hypothetical protein